MVAGVGVARRYLTSVTASSCLVNGAEFQTDPLPIARLGSRAEDADTAWSEVQCKRAGGVAVRPRVAASDPNIEDPERPSSSFPRRPHGESDLLTKGELSRSSAGLGLLRHRQFRGGRPICCPRFCARLRRRNAESYIYDASPRTLY